MKRRSWARLAIWHLLASSDADEALACASQAADQLLEKQERLEGGRVLCVLGHVRLSRGEPADDEVQRAQSILAETGVDPESELAQSIARLRRAQTAAATSAPLVCGFEVEDLTSGQLRWLSRNRPKLLPPSILDRLREDGTLQGPSQRG